MKRIISLVLVLVSLLTLSLFCFTSCTINKSEVSILWSGEGETKVPDSLINSMERAMYIKKVDYKHYGANGDAALQVQQAKDALNADPSQNVNTFFEIFSLFLKLFSSSFSLGQPSQTTHLGRPSVCSSLPVFGYSLPLNT